MSGKVRKGGEWYWCSVFGPDGVKNVGTPMVPNCGTDEVVESGLCYKKPQDGFNCSATVCTRQCPPGWRDDGLFCGKPNYYDRGVGTTKIATCPPGTELWGGLCYTTNYDTKNWERTASCTIRHRTEKVWIFDKLHTDCATLGSSQQPQWACPPDREDIAGLCYTKPRAGYNCVATVCRDVCPPGWEDIGVSCKKPSYDRGVGKLKLACPSDKEEKAGLCYTKPKDGFKNEGGLNLDQVSSADAWCKENYGPEWSQMGQSSWDWQVWGSRCSGACVHSKFLGQDANNDPTYAYCCSAFKNNTPNVFATDDVLNKANKSQGIAQKTCHPDIRTGCNLLEMAIKEMEDIRKVHVQKEQDLKNERDKVKLAIDKYKETLAEHQKKIDENITAFKTAREKLESELKKASDEAIAKVNEAIKKEEETNSKILDEIKQRSTNLSQELPRKQQELMRALETQKTENQKRLIQFRESQNARLQEELDRLKSKYEEDSRRLDEQQKTKVAELNDEFNKKKIEIENAKKKLLEEFDKFKTENEETIKKLQKQFDEQNRIYQNQIKNLNNMMEQENDKAKQALINIQKQLKFNTDSAEQETRLAIEKYLDVYNNRKKVVDQEFEDQVAKNTQQFNDNISQLSKDMEEEITSIKNKYQSIFSEYEDTNNKYKNATEEQQKRISEMINKSKKEVRETEIKYELQMKKADEEFKNKLDELDKNKNDKIKEYNDFLNSQLEKLNKKIDEEKELNEKQKNEYINKINTIMEEVENNINKSVENTNKQTEESLEDLGKEFNERVQKINKSFDDIQSIRNDIDKIREDRKQRINNIISEHDEQMKYLEGEMDKLLKQSQRKPGSTLYFILLTLVIIFGIIYTGYYYKKTKFS